MAAAGGELQDAAGGPTEGWSLDPLVLQEIVHVFGSAGSSNNEVQQQVSAVFRKISDLPDVACYYAAILSCSRYTAEVRQIAGLSLKSALSSSCKQLPAVLLGALIQPLLRSLEDPEKVVRATAGNAVSSLVCCQQLQQQLLEQLLLQLLLLLDGPSFGVFDGAFSTLSKICEDMLSDSRLMTQQIEAPTQHAVFIEFSRQHLLPKLLQLAVQPPAPATTQEQQQQIQQMAVHTLNMFGQAHAFACGSLFESFFASYWETIGALAGSPCTAVQRCIVQGIVQALDSNPRAPLQAAAPCMDFVLQCCSSSDYKLKLEALEYWPALLRQASHVPSEMRTAVLQQLRQRLGQLLPVLVANTVYTEVDFLNMDSAQFAEDDAGIADEAEDLAPRFYRGGRDGRAIDDSGDPDEDEDGDGVSSRGTWGDGWSVRKGSALALDHLAAVFRDEILPFVLPLIEEGLQLQQSEESWLRTEAAVLTLGAVAQGCQESLAPHLFNVLLFLLQLCQHPKPLLRSISCWCISRYSSWLCTKAHELQQQDELPQQQQQQALLGPVLQQLLQRLIDRNKRVQEAACSAFATIEEEARCLLVPYLSDIIATVQRALQLYQAKNLLILYDAIGTLADGLGSSLNCPVGLQLVEKLLQRWQASSESDPACLALSEAIGCCISALKGAFAAYAQMTVDRTIAIITQVIQQIDANIQNESDERPNREILECSLDLLSGVAEALGSQMLQLLQQRPQVSLLLERCCSDTSPSVLQSALALVGDLSKHCSQLLRPQIIFPLLQGHLLHGSTSVSNNAGWAVGEFAVRAGPAALDPHAETLALHLTRVLQCQDVHKALLQNVCITLGRLGLVCPGRIARLLPQFLRPWCLVMRNTRNDTDKASAFEGICLLVEANGAAGAEALLDLIISVLAFSPCPAPLEERLARMLQQVSLSFPETLRGICLASSSGEPPLPLALQQQLTQRFGVSIPS